MLIKVEQQKYERALVRNRIQLLRYVVTIWIKYFELRRLRPLVGEVGFYNPKLVSPVMIRLLKTIGL